MGDGGMVSEFSWLPWRRLGETWLPMGSTVLSSQINSPLLADECINPKFTHMHPLGRHLCWRSQPKRIATVAGKQESWRDPEVLTPGKLLSRTAICPLIGSSEREGRCWEGPGLLLTCISLSFHLHLCGDQWRRIFSPMFTSYLYIFSFYKLPLNAFH